jgi:hypothetical protein
MNNNITRECEHFLSGYHSTHSHTHLALQPQLSYTCGLYVLLPPRLLGEGEGVLIYIDRGDTYGDNMCPLL